MTITGQNFEVYKGDNKEIIITVTDDNGAILDLTSYSVVWVVYNTTLDSIVIKKSTVASNEITIPSPTSGQVHIALDSIDTESLTPRTYGHQCEIKDVSTNHSTITTGYIKILKSITHPEL